MDFDAIKNTIKEKANLYLTIVNTMVDTEMNFLKEYISAFLDEAEETEIELFLEQADKAGAHLAEAWSHASGAFHISARVAERAAEDPGVERKARDLDRQAERLGEFIETTGEQLLEADGMEVFPETREALSEGQPQPEGEPAGDGRPAEEEVSMPGI